MAKLQGSSKNECLKLKETAKLRSVDNCQGLGQTSFGQYDKKKMAVNANEVKSKMGKFMQKYKNRVGELKKTHLGLNFQLNFSSCEASTVTTTGSSLFRTKNNIILEKGCHNYKKANHTAPTAGFEQKKIEKQKTKFDVQESKQGNKNGSNGLTDSTSTNCSLLQRLNASKFELKDFEIIRKIGSGKYGEVFLVRYKPTGMFFALKKIKKADVNDIGQRHLIHEIKIQIFTDHPNIVKLYGYFHDEIYCYLVTQLCASGHLYEFLQTKKVIPQKMVQNIVKQICQGMKHLHQKNIIHRDLKLENILFQMGMIKICDFGWSIETEDLRQTFCGTPLYIAPQILQQKGYDHKIDVWCLGILTYELLFGGVPFQIREQEDFQKIVYQQVIFPMDPNVSEDAQQFISVCLTKQPAFRPNFSELEKMDFIKNCQPMILDQLF